MGVLILSLLLNNLSLANDVSDSHALFTDVLQDYVDAGKVNYEALCDDNRLEEYTEQLSRTDPDTISGSDAKLAFWLNAYNAFTLKIICDNYPVDSINDLHWGGLYIGTLLNKTIWDRRFINIHGNALSLNDIEHKIIREKFDDARVHFALVCAAKSCPPLRNEAYEGHKLDQQLDEQGQIFFSQKSKNRFDLENETAHLSKILDWFEGDFGDNDREVLLYVARFLPEQPAQAIRKDPASWDIKYTHYDWSLNRL